jgi:hypothetical protein
MLTYLIFWFSTFLLALSVLFGYSFHGSPNERYAWGGLGLFALIDLVILGLKVVTLHG